MSSGSDPPNLLLYAWVVSFCVILKMLSTLPTVNGTTARAMAWLIVPFSSYRLASYQSLISKLINAAVGSSERAASSLSSNCFDTCASAGVAPTPVHSAQTLQIAARPQRDFSLRDCICTPPRVADALAGPTKSNEPR